MDDLGGKSTIFGNIHIYIYIYIYYLRSSLGLELRSSFLSRQTLSFTYVEAQPPRGFLDAHQLGAGGRFGG